MTINQLVDTIQVSKDMNIKSDVQKHFDKLVECLEVGEHTHLKTYKIDKMHELMGHISFEMLKTKVQVMIAALSSILQSYPNFQIKSERLESPKHTDIEYKFYIQRIA